MVTKILCVAEKPSIAKAVANHLSNNVTVRGSGLVWLKNFDFTFNFGPPWGVCNVTMTSVAGHLTTTEFPSSYRWHRNHPSVKPIELFDAPVEQIVPEDKKSIQKNIEVAARSARALFIWTDCDREGENIGVEIRNVALRVNNRLDVKRAKFSNIERNHILHAAKNLVLVDEKQSNAVEARKELDLKIGACFTRWQTTTLKPLIQHLLGDSLISYGSCQFPTLGFVVDRYFRVRNFKPERFWKIQVQHQRDGIRVNFNWRRVHLFDRMIVTLLFEQCINSKTARITKVESKPTSKWKPLPLTTVELQKIGSRVLRMESSAVMRTAEYLYQQGYISYPRTETDQFDREMDLRSLVQKQVSENAWGNYAQSLIDGAFRAPRNGRNNDKAHPPIHPVNLPTQSLNADESRVYEFVVRRFLACCSDDARGETTTVEMSYGSEMFTANGLVVLERNYLDVYVYDRWESSQSLPKFEVGEEFLPSLANMVDGKTSPPDYLTESELIALMDANGIGTDATMAEHIEKIKERQYVMVQHRGALNNANGDNRNNDNQNEGGSEGRARNRGGASSARSGGTGSARGGTAVFIPSQLGVALVQGYDEIGFQMSLSKPFLRKEMEQQMKAICDGTLQRSQVVQQSLDSYREMFIRSMQGVDVLKAVSYGLFPLEFYRV